MIEELGAGTVGLMKTIKRAIDPLGIMNPGKVGPRRGPYFNAEAIAENFQLYPDDDDPSHS